MPIYTLNLCDARGAPVTFELMELANDSEGFPAAGRLLDEHLTATYVDIFQGERAVLSRHREPPLIRQIREPSPCA